MAYPPTFRLIPLDPTVCRWSIDASTFKASINGVGNITYYDARPGSSRGHDKLAASAAWTLLCGRHAGNCVASPHAMARAERLWLLAACT